MQMLAILREQNQDAFFGLLSQHLTELLPVIYTPTVGDACKQWSTLLQRPQGLYVSIKDKVLHWFPCVVYSVCVPCCSAAAVHYLLSVPAHASSISHIQHVHIRWSCSLASLHSLHAGKQLALPEALQRRQQAAKYQLSPFTQYGCEMPNKTFIGVDCPWLPHIAACTKAPPTAH